LLVFYAEEEFDGTIGTFIQNRPTVEPSSNSEAGLKKPTLISNRQRRPGESLSGRAYQQIRDEILRGDLVIGDVLSRRKLADRLNMSFLPITEAMQRLEVEGLVESRPRIGTRVRIPTEQDIRNSYVIREALESQAARLCAEHITAADKKQLLTSAKHLDNLHKVSGPEAEDSRFLFSVHTYHMQFHMRIAELGQCPGLTSAIEKAQVLVFNWLYDTAANNNKTPAKFHANLAEALCSGDPLAADSAMRAHIRNGLDQVLERLASSEHGNSWRLKSARS
jgi:GntR family transcriptional regulator, rspAB operon transcriptional repressor